MGLAEPRKRIKISHDPNNLSWSQASNSYGQRLLLSQGWKAGEGLGAKTAARHTSHELGRVAVTYKDDMLGLGAKMKSKDVEQSRAGLDAFQGLLGRLNGKSEVELKKEEQKVEDRKLAMWAQGRWGGMTFVPGGLLVQGDKFKQNDDESGTAEESAISTPAESEINEAAEKAKRKEEKRRKRGERRAEEEASDEAVARAKRKEERRKQRASEGAVASSEEQATTIKAKITKRGKANELTLVTDLSMQDEKFDPSTETKRKKKLSSNASSGSELVPEEVVEAGLIPTVPQPPRRPPVRNGRHILRGKNIHAKNMAFGDAKMLDEIFMRNSS